MCVKSYKCKASLSFKIKKIFIIKKLITINQNSYLLIYFKQNSKKLVFVYSLVI